jgi:hypothetical protein
MKATISSTSAVPSVLLDLAERCGRKPVKYVLFPQETNHE